MKAAGNTPPRSIRVPDELWEQVKATAEKRGETVTDALIRCMENYVRRNK